jgi:hypothetical protein
LVTFAKPTAKLRAIDKPCSFHQDSRPFCILASPNR